MRDAHEEGLDDRLDRLGLLAHGDRERVEPDRAPAEPREDRLHDRTVEPVEPERVDVVEIEGGAHRLDIGPAGAVP